MAAVGAARADAPVRRRPAPRPAPRPKRRARRGRVFGGVFWIAVTAVLLAGVVAMNVAVLRLNVELDRLAHERARVRAENAELAAQLAGRAASGRTHALAREQLGLEPAEPGETVYLRLDGTGR